MTEASLSRNLLERLGRRDDLRIWRQNSGLLLSPGTGHPIRAGILGCADLSGILRGGRRLELEVKTRTGRPSVHQHAFARMIVRFGGCYAVVRSVDEALAVVEEALCHS